MEITSIHKYISLNKLANGSTEVLFSGQPCLYSTLSSSKFMMPDTSEDDVSESYGAHCWRINPIFAKLVYGANVMEDIPCCMDSYPSEEESIAAGLVKLHELGAFNTEVDLPDDSYAATMNQISEDVMQYAVKQSSNIMESFSIYAKKMKTILADCVMTESEDEDHEKWIQDVKAAYPNKKLKFKGRIEQGVHTTSAEVSGEDRSYGVYHHDEGKGYVLGENSLYESELTPKEKEEVEALAAALKKDKHFISNYGGESAIDVAEKRVKER